MKKIILAPLSFILSLSLFACSKNTQKPDKTTDNTTLTNDTTVDPNPIPKRYRITKEVFDSYFNPTIDQVFALNLTIDEVSVWGEGEFAIEMNDKYRIAKGRVLAGLDENENCYTTFRKEDESLFYDEYYIRNDDSWYLDNSGTITPKETLFYTLGASFDYDKLKFDLNENVYKSNEVIEEERYDSSFEFSNLIIKFDNNKLISLSYHEKQTLHSGGVDEIFEGNISRNISNIGTTEVISPFDQKYIVDKESFDSYFNITTVDDLLKLNYTLEEVEKGVYLTGISTFAVNYGKYLINEYTYYEMTKQEGSNTLAHVDSYHYDKNTHQITSENSYYQDMDYSINSAFGLSFFNFNDFKFNEETKAYECNVVDVKGNSIYYDIKIYFENNKIIKYTYRDVYEDSGTYYDVTKTFTNVGATTIDISE